MENEKYSNYPLSISAILVCDRYQSLVTSLSNSGSTLWKIIAIIAAIAFFAVLLFK